MTEQPSRRNPPATGYRRPRERKFWIWRDRGIGYDAAFARAHGWERHPWRWMCTLCDPPAYGYRSRRGAFQAILTISMPGHFSRRHQHHEWAARRAR